MTRGRDLLAVAALTALWWTPVLLIGIEGEFAMSDDWAYAQSARTLAETGRFERPAWTWAPSVSNVVAGAALSLGLGSSHTTLRLSTLLFGWAGVLAAFGLGRRAGLPVALAGLTGALLAVNPLFFSLAYTFMTDVGFTTLCLLALWAMVHAFRGGGVPGWMSAGLFTIAAILSRQPALMLPAAAGASLMIRHRRRPRVWLGTAAVALLGLGLYSALPLLYGGEDSGRHMRVLWYLQNNVLSANAVYHVARATMTVAAIAGLSLLPLWPVLRPGWRALATGGLGAAVLLGLARGLQVAPPLHLNVLRGDFGLGPMTLPGALPDPAMGPLIWALLDGLGFTLTIAFLIDLVARRRRLEGRPDLWLLLIFPGLSIGLLAFQFPFFDRWMLPFLVPFAVVLLHAAGASSAAGHPERGGVALAFALLLPLLVWSGLGTADTLDHYRARTLLLADLETSGVSPDRIDGGFEFNGEHHFDRRDSDPARFKQKPGSRWVIDDEYVVTMARALAGYDRLAERSVRHRLPPGQSKIYVYRRRATR